MTSVIRTFIAVEIPEELKDSIREVQDVLRKEGGDVKWVRPESVHMTLKFLGNVENSRLPEVGEAVKKASAGCRRFVVRSTGAGFFPGPGRPRVIWVGIGDGIEALLALAGELDTELSRMGFETEKRPFSPHLTIGRVRSPHRIGRTVEKLQSISIPSIGFSVERIVVMKSDLQRTGAVYTPIQIIKLEV